MRCSDDRGEARTRFLVLTAAAIGALLFLLPLHSHADQGDCCQPATTGPNPVVTDCLVMLGVVVGSQTCTPACACAPKGSLPTSATDALLCLQLVTGQSPSINCPCSSATSTTRTTVSSTTSTTGPLGPDCGSSQVPTCDGACPLGSACMTLDGESCACLPFNCGQLVPAPQCYGLCPGTQTCISVDGQCACADTVQDQCSPQLSPATCDGQCPEGSFCTVSNPLSQTCECVAIGCGVNQFGPPSCWGECPGGTVCQDIDSQCVCMPAF